MTATENVLQQLEAEAKKKADREAKAERAYYALVREMSDGAVDDAAKVPKILSDAGRSADDLKADLQTLEDRTKLREQVQRKAQLESEVATLQQEFGQLWRDFAAFREKCGDRQKAIIARQCELKVSIVGLQDAEQRLRSVHLQPSASLAAVDLENELRSLNQQRDKLLQMRDRAGDRLKAVAPRGKKFALIRGERNPQFQRDLTGVEEAGERELEAAITEDERMQADVVARLEATDGEISRVQAALSDLDEAALTP